MSQNTVRARTGRNSAAPRFPALPRADRSGQPWPSTSPGTLANARKDGRGGTPDLALGVDLSGFWEVTNTVTQTSGSACTSPVGSVEVETLQIAS